MIINGHLKTSTDGLIVIKKISALLRQKRQIGQGDNKTTEYVYCVMMDNGNAITISHDEYMDLTKFMTLKI